MSVPTEEIVLQRHFEDRHAAFERPVLHDRKARVLAHALVAVFAVALAVIYGTVIA